MQLSSATLGMRPNGWEYPTKRSSIAFSTDLPLASLWISLPKKQVPRSQCNSTCWPSRCTERRKNRICLQALDPNSSGRRLRLPLQWHSLLEQQSRSKKWYVISNTVVFTFFWMSDFLKFYSYGGQTLSDMKRLRKKTHRAMISNCRKGVMSGEHQEMFGTGQAACDPDFGRKMWNP